MSAAHTNGRLHVVELDDCFMLMSEDSATVAHTTERSPKERLDAERLALCWNTHAQLVAALEGFVAWYDADTGVRLPIDEARAALAAAKGEQ